MTDPEPDASGDVFDIRNFRKLIKLMRAYDLHEVDIKRGDTRIRLQRGAPPATVTYAAPPMMAQAHSAPGQSVPAAGSAAPAASDAKAHYIKSPTVGTFYVASGPDTPPFVKVGDQVGPESTVCIIEAMKVFNEIQAECAGKILAVLVQNGDPVEFNQPLFKVEMG
jgi:acetyl-CoA carboxylase biotin carboxyl carrier protein